jgi:hypothetical protein
MVNNLQSSFYFYIFLIMYNIVVITFSSLTMSKPRFLGLFDVSAGRTADQLFSFLTGKFEKFNLQKKLVAQTYDGATVMSGQLNGLQ